MFRRRLNVVPARYEGRRQQLISARRTSATRTTIVRSTPRRRTARPPSRLPCPLDISRLQNSHLPALTPQIVRFAPEDQDADATQLVHVVQQSSRRRSVARSSRSLRFLSGSSFPLPPAPPLLPPCRSLPTPPPPPAPCGNRPERRPAALEAASANPPALCALHLCAPPPPPRHGDGGGWRRLTAARRGA